MITDLWKFCLLYKLYLEIPILGRTGTWRYNSDQAGPVALRSFLGRPCGPDIFLGVSPYGCSYGKLHNGIWLVKRIVSMHLSTSVREFFQRFLQSISPKASFAGAPNNIQVPKKAVSSFEQQKLGAEDLGYEITRRNLRKLYGGIIVDSERLPANPRLCFHASFLTFSLEGKDFEKKGIWLKLPAEKSELVPVAVKEGFRVSPRRERLCNVNLLAATRTQRVSWVMLPIKLRLEDLSSVTTRYRISSIFNLM
ncbi:putative PPPDE thiol peptidase family protein [Hibiscus syriacus]|uniref:PPPDE thiol peptidase family protein n=1 Tax=Hibiscus syriacus TaxID=106335 RepID=A0A6A2YPQ2_HIBSY|nr:putative PPPDE thiol peptidase family protein [Hibiscus syriacus]